MMTTELKYTLIFYFMFFISGFIFHKINSRKAQDKPDSFILNKIASISGIILIISFACAITMTVITVTKFFN
jgi:uncharacterized membrane protein